MMSYIITDSDGNIVVIDGGQAFNIEYLIQTLQGITGKIKPVINAWFLTHPHSDHIEAFLKAIEVDGKCVDIEKVYYNFPSQAFIEKYESAESYTISDFYKALPLFENKTHKRYQKIEV